jgi:hypothetical protein
MEASTVNTNMMVMRSGGKVSRNESNDRSVYLMIHVRLCVC